MSSAPSSKAVSSTGATLASAGSSQINWRCATTTDGGRAPRRQRNRRHRSCRPVAEPAMAHNRCVRNDSPARRRRARSYRSCAGAAALPFDYEAHARCYRQGLQRTSIHSAAGAAGNWRCERLLPAKPCSASGGGPGLLSAARSGNPVYVRSVLVGRGSGRPGARKRFDWCRETRQRSRAEAARGRRTLEAMPAGIRSQSPRPILVAPVTGDS